MSEKILNIAPYVCVGVIIGSLGGVLSIGHLIILAIGIGALTGVIMVSIRNEKK